MALYFVVGALLAKWAKTQEDMLHENLIRAFGSFPLLIVVVVFVFFLQKRVIRKIGRWRIHRILQSRQRAGA